MSREPPGYLAPFPPLCMAYIVNRPSVACAICGARIETSPETGYSLGFERQMRLIDVDRDKFGAEAVPYVTDQAIIIHSDYSPRLEPEVWNSEIGVSVRLGSKIGRFGQNCQPDETQNMCFPIHAECWRTLQSVGTSIGIDDPGEYIPTLFKIFENAAYERYGLLLPHKYGISGDIMTYRNSWNIPPGLEILKSVPDPNVGTLEFASLYWLEPYRPPQLEPFRQDSVFSIPNILPLPVELTLKILSYLDPADVFQLGMIEHEERIEVPEYIWKEYFDARSALGWFHKIRWDLRQNGPRSPIKPDQKITSWYLRAFLASELGSRRHDRLLFENMRRVWGLALDLIDTALDVKNAKVSNLSYGNDFFDPDQFEEDQVLAVQAFKQRPLVAYDNINSDTAMVLEGAQTNMQGTISDFTTTGVLVSYIGAGKLRFVSGLRFLPSNVSIGLMNLEDQVFVDLAGPRDRQMVLRLELTKYGIKSLSTYEAADKNQSYFDQDDDDIATIYRHFTPGAAGINIDGVWVGVDVSKMTQLAIKSKSFAKIEDMTPQEAFIQRYMWAGVDPTVYSEVNLNTERFYTAAPSLMPYDRYTSTFVLNYSGTTTVARTICRRFKNNHAYRTEFDPFHYVYFSSPDIIRISFWCRDGIDLSIAGIEIYKLNGDSYLLGQREGASTDLTPDDRCKEYLLGFEVFTNDNLASGMVIGLAAYTSRGRKLWVRTPPKVFEHSLQSFKLVPKDGEEIVGLYGRFHGGLKSLGIITSPSEEARVQLADIKDMKIGNQQLMCWVGTTQVFKNKWLQNCLSKLKVNYFTSSANVGECVGFTYYTRETWDSYRLIGLQFYYKDQDSRLLGQVANATDEKTYYLDEECESISGMEVIYDNRVWLHDHVSKTGECRSQVVAGLVFIVDGKVPRRIECGKTRKQRKAIRLMRHKVNRYKAEEDSTAPAASAPRKEVEFDWFALSWTYTEHLDFIMRVDTV